MLSARFVLARKIMSVRIASLNGKKGDYVTEPLAVLVNKDIFKELKSPGAELIAGKTLILE